ncbi:hypothetical protein QA802_18725 [Streptomyces sp. B21-105]|uniref:hypothetical protein n=1 Tax=Streptomyces sp. B21-105 TaxID=3039417 RepID=UPI002FF1AACD
MLFEPTEVLRCAENQLAHEMQRGRGTLRGRRVRVWCARVSGCLNATVIEFAAMLIVAGLIGRLFWRKVRQREEAAARDDVIKVPVCSGTPRSKAGGFAAGW